MHQLHPHNYRLRRPRQIVHLNRSNIVKGNSKQRNINNKAISKSLNSSPLLNTPLPTNSLLPINSRLPLTVPSRSPVPPTPTPQKPRPHPIPATPIPPSTNGPTHTQLLPQPATSSASSEIPNRCSSPARFSNSARCSIPKLVLSSPAFVSHGHRSASKLTRWARARAATYCEYSADSALVIWSGFRAATPATQLSPTTCRETDTPCSWCGTVTGQWERGAGTTSTAEIARIAASTRGAAPTTST